MGAGSDRVYERMPDGTRRYIGRHPERAWYAHKGKHYLIGGNAWTGFYRHEISRDEYNYLVDVLSAQWDRAPGYKPWWPMTKLQKARANNWVGNYLSDLLKKRAAKRLEHLRGELRAERISYAEIAELQSLALYITDDDVELREAAGVPEGATV